MKKIDESEVADLLAQKKQPIIIQDTPEWNRFLDEFAQLGVEVEIRKAAAKAKEGA